MIASRRRWLIVPFFVGAGVVALACKPSGDDDDLSCSGSTCANDAGNSGDATRSDASSTIDASDGAVVIGGPPITLVQGLDLVNGIAVDSTYVYFDQSALGAVARVPIAGGALEPETLASGFLELTGVIVDSTNVYVGEASSGKIYRFPTSGSPGGGVPDYFATGAQAGVDFAITPTRLYWGTGDYGGTIYTVLLTDPPETIGTVYAGGPSDDGVSADSKNLYWGNNVQGSLYYKDLNAIYSDAGNQVQLVGTGVFTKVTETPPIGGSVYFGAIASSNSTGGIYSLNIGPPVGSPSLLTTDSNTPFHLVADQANVYWISNGVTTVGLQYIPLTGGTTKLLVPTADPIFLITQDANYIYYVTGSVHDMSIVRVTKPIP